MSQPLLTLFPYAAQVRGERLFIGGCDTVALAEEFGTPLYVLDRGTLREKCSQFREEFSRRYSRSRVIYACKALVLKGLLHLLEREGLGLDVVSGGELWFAREAGFPMERVYFHGNNKGKGELEQALEFGVGRVVVDNFYELVLLEEVASRMGRVPEILLRLSPGVDPHTHTYTTTGIVDSKFGFLMERAEEAVARALSSPHLRLVGLHFHLGSPIYEVEPYQEALGRVLGFAQKMRAKYNWSLQELSPGGGFAVSYTRDRLAPPLSYYAQGIVEALQGVLGGPDEPYLVVEPGRAVVAQAGVALYRVGASKDIPGVRTYVSVDGGMGDNIRPALYGARYEALLANRAAEVPSQRVTIAGKFCESGDILLKDVLLPPLSPGDILAVPVSGAYSIPMSSNYNANPRPAVVAVEEGRAEVWRRRESYRELTTLDGK